MPKVKLPSGKTKEYPYTKTGKRAAEAAKRRIKAARPATRRAY